MRSMYAFFWNLQQKLSHSSEKKVNIGKSFVFSLRPYLAWGRLSKSYQKGRFPITSDIGLVSTFLEYTDHEISLCLVRFISSFNLIEDGLFCTVCTFVFKGQFTRFTNYVQHDNLVVKQHLQSKAKTLRFFLEMWISWLTKLCRWFQ